MLNIQYLNISWELQFLLSSVSNWVLTHSAVGFLSHTFEDSVRGPPVLDRTLNGKEDLAGNVASIGKLGMWWQQKSFHQGFYGIAYAASHYPVIESLTTLPCSLPSSYSGLRAVLQTYQAHECFSTSVLAVLLLGTPFNHTSTQLPLLLSSLNSNVTKAFPDTSLYQNNPTVYSLAPLLWFFSQRTYYYLT